MERYFQMVIERCSILESGKWQRTIRKMDQIFNNTIDTHAANGCQWDEIDTNQQSTNRSRTQIERCPCYVCIEQ